MNPFALDHKVAVVTGGGSGIGESICRIFASSGANVHIIDRDLEKANRVANSITDMGFQACAHQADVSRQEQMVSIFQEIISEEDRLDIVICNAGISQIGKLENTTEDDFDRVYDVNVKGVYNTMYAGIEQMKKQKSGVFLILASVAAMIGIPERYGYSMTKGAVLTMTYSVAKDYLPYGIRCNSISPGRVHTPFVDDFISRHYPGREKEMFDALSKTQPVGRMASPDEIAYLALYLCSDKSSFITGVNIPIDGGSITLNM